VLLAEAQATSTIVINDPAIPNQTDRAYAARSALLAAVLA